MSEGVVRAWRLTKARDAGDLTGQGAARDGQRWNQPGQRAVYLGMTPEITVLEVLVHLNGVLSAPLVLSGYDVPAGPGLIAKPDPNTLPEGWNAIPHGQACAAFGGDWLRTGQELGLVLPSVVVTQARNELLNPGQGGAADADPTLLSPAGPAARSPPEFPGPRFHRWGQPSC